MTKKTKRVWGLYYTTRANSMSRWERNDWTGPCGVYIVGRELPGFYLNCLSDRPFFFRTRTLARQKVKELTKKTNVSWQWVKYTVRPITLSWTE